MMELVLVGLNHKTAPIEIRERVAFRERLIPEALTSLRNHYGFREALILSTCNRVEILGRGDGNGSEAENLRDFLARYHEVDSSILNGHLYVYQSKDLIHHLFRVASSLDSMVPGEAQILGQLKLAYSQAQEAGSVGETLCRLLPHAFFVAKRVRNETRVGQSAVSVSSVAVELATRIFGDLGGRTVLLLGAGKMAELAADALLKAGVGTIRVSNRTAGRGRELAARFGGEEVPFQNLADHLVLADIVIVSTGASRHVITVELADQVIRRRKYAPLFIVDISVPRNVDPEVNEIDNVISYDIDDLQTAVSANLEGRQQEATSAEAIVSEEVANFTRGIHGVRIGPLVSSLRQRLESICLEELARTRDSLSSEDYVKLERVMLRAAHRIAHPLMVQMKKSRSHQDPLEDEVIRVIADAFRLGEDE